MIRRQHTFDVGPILTGVRVANLHSPVRSITVSALMDTGATDSGISLQMVEDLNLREVTTFDLQTARGKIQAGVYLVRVDLPNAAEPLEIVAFECDDGDHFDMLIGRNILRTGEFCMDKESFTFDQQPDSQVYQPN